MLSVLDAWEIIYIMFNRISDHRPTRSEFRLLPAITPGVLIDRLNSAKVVHKFWSSGILSANLLPHILFYILKFFYGKKVQFPGTNSLY